MTWSVEGSRSQIRSLWQESQVLSGEDNSRSLEDRGLGRVLLFLFGDVQEKPVTHSPLLWGPCSLLFTS